MKTKPTMRVTHRVFMTRPTLPALMMPMTLVMLMSIMALMALSSSGCETAGQDIADFTESLLPPSPGEAARMALDPHDADQRREGVLLLSAATFGGQEVYLSMYRDYVESERNPLVRAVAIRALARHGSPGDAKIIAAHLGDGNLQVRWEAAKGLQRIHQPAVVPALLAVLRDIDETSDVRSAAATALGQYPEDRVFQGLVSALNARELSVNVAAERSLTVMTGRTFALDPRAWVTWYNEQAGDPFTEGGQYLFPTYWRSKSFLEKLAFWSSKSFELPGVPAGLTPRNQRSTYSSDGDDKDGPTDRPGDRAPASADDAASDAPPEGGSDGG